MDASKGEEIWSAGSGLAYRKLADGGMIYDREKRQVHHLNCTAAHVWEHCQKGGRVDEIAQELCLRYDVDFQIARADVEEVLAELAAARLIAL
jgi:PqqD family protein of HPr-rel-A system